MSSRATRRVALGLASILACPVWAAERPLPGLPVDAPAVERTLERAATEPARDTPDQPDQASTTAKPAARQPVPETLSPVPPERGSTGAARPAPGSAPPAPPPQRGTRLFAAPLPVMPGSRSDTPSEDDGVIADEVLLTAPDMAAAERQRESLRPLGARIVRRTALSGLGYVLTVYRVPKSADPNGLLDQLRRVVPGAQPEYNRRYRLLAEVTAREYAADMVGFTRRDDAAGEGADLRLAMLDAPVDTAHPALAGARIEHIDVTGLAASSDRTIDHGTSVASLLVGNGPVRGALPGASLTAVTIFGHAPEAGWHTRTDWWLQGLDAVAASAPPPDAVNMSFGGAPSVLIEGALRMLHRRGLRFAAAAGNDGPDSEVAFPASLPEVLAVTAVDVRGMAYVQAPKSDLVALAAPGVDVWAAAQGGGVYATGTSFAAPWVTACIAVARRAGQDTGDLLKLAQDLGTPGKDPTYGAGLVRHP